MSFKRTLLAAAICTLVMIPLSTRCHAQASDANVDSYVESLRADLHADKVAIITQVMQFNDKDGAVFWPIYKKYAFDESAVNDKRVALIKQYAAQYGTMTDAAAKTMGEQELAFETDRINVKKDYYKKFLKVLPATTVLRFFQLDHRMDLIIDVGIASQLPPLQPAAAAAPAK